MAEPLAQNTRTLKVIVISLGVLIVVALGALVIGLVIQAKKANDAVLTPTAGPVVPLAAPNSAILPEGAQIKASHTAERHLVIEYIDPENGQLAIAVVELRSGRLLYRVRP